MIKKKIAFSGLIAIVLIIVIGYIIFSKRAEDTEDAFQFIPDDAIVIAETEEPQQLISSLKHESNTWQAVSKLKGAMEFAGKIDFLDSLFNSNKVFADAFKNVHAVVSLHETGKSNFQYLLVNELPIDLGGKKSLDIFIETYKLKEATSRKYENTVVYDIEFSHHQSLSFCTRRGYLLISSSPLLIEDAIRKKNHDEHFSKERFFKKVYHTKGKHVEANIYVQANYLINLTGIQVQPGYKELAKLLGKQFIWSELDLKLIDQGLILNGFTVASDSIDQYLSYYSHNPAGNIEGYRLLPSGTSFFISKYIENFSEYRAFAKKWLSRQELYNQYRSKLSEVNQLLGFDVIKEFSSILGKEITLAAVDPNKNDYQAGLLAVASTMGKSKTTDKLNELIKLTAKSSNKSVKQLKTSYKADESSVYDIYYFPSDDLLYALYGEFISGIEKPYALVFDNYLVFADNKAILKKLVESNIRQNLITSKPDFKDISEIFPSRSNILFYTNLLRNTPLTEHIFNESLNEGLADQIEIVKSFASIGASFYSTNDMLNTNIFVTGTKATRKESNLEWKTLLDTTAAFKPQLFVNHYTKNNDIFVQDKGNKIYLINETGRILWKLPLSEKITSEVHVIDFYNNGKYQLLFSTKNYVHCFDRLGNYVEHYPIRLRASSTQGISLIRYSKKDPYRIFVPTDNQKVYAYNIDGQILKGWSFDKTDHRIISRVNHIRIDHLDYILFSDEQQVYILNRRGEKRVVPDKNYPMSGNDFFPFKGETLQTSGFVSTDTLGHVVKYFTNGTVKVLDHTRAARDHYFVCQDIDDNGIDDYILFDGHHLQIASNEKILIKKDTDHKHLPELAIFNFGLKNKKIGLVNTDLSKVVLVDIKGNVQNGFPLDGVGLFTIGKLKPSQNYFNILVNQSDNFLVNYKLY